MSADTAETPASARAADRGSDQPLHTATPRLAGWRTEPAAWLPALDGLNTALGLGFMGGRIDLYRRALTRFVERYAAPWADLDDALAAGERARCVHLAHALRGAAATIGAERLADLVGHCEAALGAPVAVSLDDLKGLSVSVNRELLTIVQGLGGWLDAQEKATPTT